jgi:hypothetical protein
MPATRIWTQRNQQLNAAGWELSATAGTKKAISGQSRSTLDKNVTSRSAAFVRDAAKKDLNYACNGWIFAGLKWLLARARIPHHGDFF